MRPNASSFPCEANIPTLIIKIQETYLIDRSDLQYKSDQCNSSLQLQQQQKPHYEKVSANCRNVLDGMLRFVDAFLFDYFF